MRTLNSLIDLTGRVALVTGARGHLGGTAVQALRECGAFVVGADQADASGSGIGDQADAFHSVDLLEENSTRGLVRTVVAKYGGLDILVHTAAYVGTSSVPGWAVPFQAQSVDAWDKAVRVNLTSAFIMVQEGCNALAKSGRGAIVLVSSIYGMVGPDNRIYAGTSMANPAGYGASKAGLEHLGRHFSTVLAPRIRVNTLTPGGIVRAQPESFRSAYEARTPLQRMGTEEDFKGAIAFLCSDMSAYVTGHNLVVDGGWTAW